MKNQAANNGTFIPKPGFTVVQNSVARDWNLSSGALGLYTRIQSYITMENITLTKGSLMERVPEGEYAFNTAWNELKSKGYLFIHVYPGEKGRFVYQYELRPDNSGMGRCLPFLPRPQWQCEKHQSYTKPNRNRRTAC